MHIFLYPSYPIIFCTLLNIGYGNMAIIAVGRPYAGIYRPISA